jgi:hypothetical protein
MSSDLVVRGLASGLLATWQLMGKSCRLFHRINPYARLYWMVTEKGCKCNLRISSSMAKHASFPSLWVNHFVLQNLLTREVSVKLHPYWPQLFCVIKSKVLELNIYYYSFLFSFLSGATFSLSLASPQSQLAIYCCFDILLSVTPSFPKLFASFSHLGVSLPYLFTFQASITYIISHCFISILVRYILTTSCKNTVAVFVIKNHQMVRVLYVGGRRNAYTVLGRETWREGRGRHNREDNILIIS